MDGFSREDVEKLGRWCGTFKVRDVDRLLELMQQAQTLDDAYIAGLRDLTTVGARIPDVITVSEAMGFTGDSDAGAGNQLGGVLLAIQGVRERMAAFFT